MIGETISVIIPCYNAEETIERSIRSVCEQHCAERIELIIVDDGSTDSSAEKIKVSTPPGFPENRKCVQICISGKQRARRSCELRT